MDDFRAVLLVKLLRAPKKSSIVLKQMRFMKKLKPTVNAAVARLKLFSSKKLKLN